MCCNNTTVIITGNSKRSSQRKLSLVPFVSLLDKLCQVLLTVSAWPLIIGDLDIQAVETIGLELRKIQENEVAVYTGV